MPVIPRILVTGRDGQVGWELRRTLAPLGEVIAVGRDVLDMADPQATAQLVREIRPQIIVNAAGPDDQCPHTRRDGRRSARS